jgi:hypothetical protein
MPLFRHDARARDPMSIAAAIAAPMPPFTPPRYLPLIITLSLTLLRA